jgi:hypothetical protein
MSNLPGSEKSFFNCTPCLKETLFSFDLTLWVNDFSNVGKASFRKRFIFETAGSNTYSYFELSNCFIGKLKLKTAPTPFIGFR